MHRRSLLILHISSLHNFLFIVSKFFPFDFLSLIFVGLFFSPFDFLSLLLSSPLSPLPGVFSPGHFLSLFFSLQHRSSMLPAPSCSVPAPIRLTATWQHGPSLSTSSSDAAPRAPALSLTEPPYPGNLAWLIKRKQTPRFPLALRKTPLIKEYKSNFMIH